VVQGGIGLDGVLDRVVVGRGDRAAERRDDPAERLSASPNGSPIATTGSPTASAVESPNVSGWSVLATALMWMTATSVVASLPTSVAR
jgi:hypothetical protein